MAKYNFILDPRVKKDGTTSVMLSFIHKRYRRKVNLGISVDASLWNEEEATVAKNHERSKVINQRMRLFKAAADSVILRHLHSDVDGETIFNQIVWALFPDRVEKQEAEKEDENTLLSVARRFTELKKPSASNI